ncbi:MAG: ATP-binding cassette domain-containing protein [Neomegalonema sp.]|nr:ATP-binding cassette domain-containing protein [Neomegalonema sp.]
MAEPPLLTLTDITLSWGGNALFSGVTLAAGRGERAALVGRNGSGKSTLLKIMAGLVAADSGERFVQPGAKISYLPQEPDLSGFATLADYAAAELEDHERYKAEIAMEGLEVREDADPASASGGERRRAALARLLAGEPDLMLLDEPTNHLDIATIEWLEQYLRDTRTGFILISHDRAFLTNLTRSTFWIDRGVTRRLDQGFGAFEDWRDKTFEEEEMQRHKLDRQIKREEHWIIHGVSGRRKRNVRRVAELANLRQQRKDMVMRKGAAAMALETGQSSGKLVIEAKEITKRFDARVIVEDFSIKVQRGDRLAFVGPNGAGKTTLLKMLTGELAPDQGSVRLGTNLEMAVFDQARARLDETKTLWESLTEDEILGMKGSNDQILVRGRPKHVVGYLKEFLFDERQARGPVSALSGGERARLLLARIMARSSNLLVLDEPTNDLDVETLDLLEDLLAEYEGTLLLVSHDRDFIDRIATSTIAMEGDGRAVEYAGGWTDYRTQRALGESEPSGSGKAAAKPARKQDKSASSVQPAPRAAPAAKSLSFAQQKRLDALPNEIARLEAEIGKLEEFLSTPDLYSKEPKKFQQATDLLAERQTKLTAAEEEWLELEELREG